MLYRVITFVWILSIEFQFFRTRIFIAKATFQLKPPDSSWILPANFLRTRNKSKGRQSSHERALSCVIGRAMMPQKLCQKFLLSKEVTRKQRIGKDNLKEKIYSDVCWKRLWLFFPVTYLGSRNISYSNNCLILLFEILIQITTRNLCSTEKSFMILCCRIFPLMQPASTITKRLVCSVRKKLTLAGLVKDNLPILQEEDGFVPEMPVPSSLGHR